MISNSTNTTTFCWKNVLAQPQQASQLEPELGTAQPQLVFFLFYKTYSQITFFNQFLLFYKGE
jgi:hypothetical protein